MTPVSALTTLTAGTGSRPDGLAVLVRAAIRRDRLLLVAWSIPLVLVVYASAAATGDLYVSADDRVRAAQAINGNAATVALYGPILDVHSLGELAMTKVTVLYAAILAALLVAITHRHTRGEEESGRAEMLGATAIDIHAPLTATVIEGTLVAVTLGALASLASIAGGLPVLGSVGLGASWAGTGLVGMGLALVASQLSASGRTCLGLAGATLGGCYLLRALADVEAPWLGWLTPLGWNTRLAAWSQPRWWVLLLYPLTAAVLTVLARALRRRRDLGSGLLAAHAGPRSGSPRLDGPLALAWRMHAPTLLAWTVGATACGLLMGAITPSVGDLLDTEAGRRMVESIGGAGALEDALLQAVFAIAAWVITCLAVAVVVRGATDERDGRAEQVLATTATRRSNLAATMAVALGGTTWALAVTGLATGLGSGRDPGTLTMAGLSQAPAVWVVTGLVVLLYAVRSTWAVFGWGVLALFVGLGQLGELIGLPTWVIDLSPYRHTSGLPGGAVDLGAQLALAATSVVLTILAFARYQRRDIV